MPRYGAVIVFKRHVSKKEADAALLSLSAKDLIEDPDEPIEVNDAPISWPLWPLPSRFERN
jgi:hypothetical protein